MTDIVSFKTADEITYERCLEWLYATYPTYDKDKFVLDRDKLNLAREFFARIEILRDECILPITNIDFVVDFETKFASVILEDYTFPLTSAGKDLIGEMILECDAVDMFAVNNENLQIRFEFIIWK